jgi:hypothetical protein
MAASLLRWMWIVFDYVKRAASGLRERRPVSRRAGWDGMTQAQASIHEHTDLGNRRAEQGYGAVATGKENR